MLERLATLADPNPGATLARLRSRLRFFCRVTVGGELARTGRLVERETLIEVLALEARRLAELAGREVAAWPIRSQATWAAGLVVPIADAELTLAADEAYRAELVGLHELLLANIRGGGARPESN
jgi:hypothetical protein